MSVTVNGTDRLKKHLNENIGRIGLSTQLTNKKHLIFDWSNSPFWQIMNITIIFK